MKTFDMNQQNFHEIKSMHQTHQALLKTITEQSRWLVEMELEQQTSQSLSVQFPYSALPSSAFVHSINQPLWGHGSILILYSKHNFQFAVTKLEKHHENQMIITKALESQMRLVFIVFLLPLLDLWKSRVLKNLNTVVQAGKSTSPKDEEGMRCPPSLGTERAVSGFPPTCSSLLERRLKASRGAQSPRKQRKAVLGKSGCWISTL